MDECTRNDIPVLIAIKGTVSAGKSSLIDYYTDRHVNRLFEPAHIWQDFANSNILNMKYSDPKRYAFCFQILADLTRLDQLHNIRYCKQVSSFLILPVPYYHIKCQLFNYKIYRTSLIFF